MTDLATRASLTVAAFLLLSVGISVFRLADGDVRREAAKELAVHIARQLDAVSQVDGEVRLVGGADMEGPFSLPGDLAGSSYRLEVRRGEVRLTDGILLAVAALRAPVHPFAPDGTMYTAESLATLDAGATVIDVGVAFLVVRTLIEVKGEADYHTFVHLPR